MVSKWCDISIMQKRAKQANFVALNLRLPPELHKELVKAAGKTRSLNAEILGRLQMSLLPPVKVLVRDPSGQAKLMAVIKKLTKEASDARNRLTEADGELLRALKWRVDNLEERLRDKEK